MTDQMQELMTRRPTRELVIALPDQAIEEFRERGFTSLSRITTDEEIEWMREVYDLLFSGELTLPKGALVNNVNRPLSQQQRAQTTSQVLFPESIYPQLRETIYYRNSQRMALQLIGNGDLTCWGHMPRKAAHNMEHVAWHQDEAYWDPHFDHDAAAFWMPLDDATKESGAMSFIPGSHKGDLLRHGFPGDDPSVTALMLREQIPVERAVLHPIPAGGVSVHHKRAIHSSGPNLTDKPRRAYVNVWNNKPIERLIPHDRPWYWQKKEARDRHNDEKTYYHDETFADVTRRRQAG
jgi:hypothetical protein